MIRDGRRSLGDDIHDDNEREFFVGGKGKWFRERVGDVLLR